VYPHLAVRDNVGYSLRARGASAAKIRQATESVAARLGIAHLLDRAPGTLSGGEAQRVAMARAAVRRPACLLLDEPLASLDAPLRRELRGELAALHKSQQVTTLFVTHDQEEALAVAERIVLLHGGTIVQIGTPVEIYERPANRFVAEFFGSPPPSFFQGRLAVSEGRLWFESGVVRLAVTELIGSSMAAIVERPIVVGVRAEAVRIKPWPAQSQDQGKLEGIVKSVEFAGNRTLVQAIATDGATFRAMVATHDRIAVGEFRRFFVDPGRLLFFAADDSGMSLAQQAIAG
jgi:multiple sugar transport system ATP-binding protein